MAEEGKARRSGQNRSRRPIIAHSKPLLGDEEIGAVVRVLHSGQIAQGKKVEEFEAKVADYIGSKFAIAVSSGTAALHLALLGLGIRRGDEVILPSYVCPSPYLAILHAGATPRLADINPSDYNIDARAAKKELSKRTKAIIVPHMFGTPADIRELSNIGIPIVEDCAQAFGAEYEGVKVGGLGKVSIFSFYATKMITTGEGGMVLTDDKDIYHKLLGSRDYDKKTPDCLKFNYKMTDLQAALGIIQLKRLNAFMKRRMQIASFYTDHFSRLGVKVPSAFKNRKSVHYRYVIDVRHKERIQRESKKWGVMCENPVWRPLHLSLKTAKLPATDHAYRHALSIPIYPALKKNEIESTARIVSSLIRENGK